MNDDDDDDNGVHDYDDPGPSAEEDGELVPLVLSVNQSLPADEPVVLEVLSGAQHLRSDPVSGSVVLFGNADKSDPILLNSATWTVADFATPKTFWVEAVTHSDQVRDIEFRAVYNGPGGACEDRVTLTALQVDVDIDSDNTNGTSPPDRSHAEDAIEFSSDGAGNWGKFIAANFDNDDDPEPCWDAEVVHERIPDLIDGYNLDGVPGNPDDVNPDEDDFIPFIVELLPPIDLNIARIFVFYDASNPMDVDIVNGDERLNTPPAQRAFNMAGAPGMIRVWTKPGQSARDGNDVAQGGDFVASGIEYSPADLGFSTTSRTVTFYIEGIGALNPRNGGLRVSVDPDGPGPAQDFCGDEVNVTVVDVFFKQAESGTLVTPFDWTLNPPGLAVPLPAGGTSGVSVEINPPELALKFRSTNPARATVPEGPFTGEEVFELTVTSVSAKEAVLEAYLDTPDQLVIGRLRLYCLPKRRRTVQFYSVRDEANHSTTRGAKDAQVALTGLIDYWGPQANIHFQGADPLLTPVTIDGDLGAVIQGFSSQNSLGICETAGSEARRVGRSSNGLANHDIFFVWEVELDCPPDDDPNGTEGAEAITLVPDPRSLIDDRLSLPPDLELQRTVMHEIAHQFSSDPNFAHGEPNDTSDYDWSLVSNLMNVAAEEWITLRQAIIANEALESP